MLVDFETVERARDGDPAAFTVLVNTYRRRILGTVSRLIGRPEDVEDVAQEVFLRLYDSLGQLRHPQIFEPWLYRLTMNASLDYLRKRKRRPESRMSDLSEQQMLAADARVGTDFDRDERQKKQIREFTTELLSQVSEEDRMLLSLKEIEGLSLKELESVYDINENALKVRLYRARQRVLKVFAAMRDKDPRRKEAV
jgi:RNA polymerase sigma-70 factor (ECF subfamily)